jgi:serine/threonine protein kinase
MQLQWAAFVGPEAISTAGGRHTVYKATHPDGRARALKEFPAHEYPTLLKEAMLLRRLQHPHLMEVESVVWKDDSHVYLVMPFCEGGTLQDVVNRRELGDSIHVKNLLRQVHATRPRSDTRSADVQCRCAHRACRFCWPSSTFMGPA